MDSNDPISCLHVFVFSGFVEPMGIAIALGWTEPELVVVLSREELPTPEQRAQLQRLVADYKASHQRVNATWMRRRIEGMPDREEEIREIRGSAR